MITVGQDRSVNMFAMIWLIAAVATWLGMLGFSNFVLWGDHWLNCLVGMSVAGALCLFVWPVVLLAAVGKLFSDA